MSVKGGAWARSWNTAARREKPDGTGSTITNMGGAGRDNLHFPSDKVTHAFLKAQGREEDYMPLAAERGRRGTTRSLRSTFPRWSLWPRAQPRQCEARAQPFHDEGRPGVHRQLHKLSYADLMTVAGILKGKNGISRSEPCHCAGQPPGAGNAERERRAHRPAGRARAFWKAPAAPASA